MNARMQAPERGTLAKLTDLPSRANQFHAHVQRMGEPLRSEFKLPPVHQLGVMVPNVQKAAQDLEQLGMVCKTSACSPECETVTA